MYMSIQWWKTCPVPPARAEFPSLAVPPNIVVSFPVFISARVPPLPDPPESPVSLIA